MRGSAQKQQKQELNQTRSMRGRAHSKKTRTQTNKINARARAFKKNKNSSKHDRCRGARIQKNFELKHTRLMCVRANSTKISNSIKQCQCAGARIQRNRERKQTKSMRGRAHSKTLRNQRNKINVKARAFKTAANSRKQSQCAGARIQQNRELKQNMSMCGRAHSKNANSSNH